MSEPHIALVATTIDPMASLINYVEAAKYYDGEVDIIIIPDLNTTPILMEQVIQAKKSAAKNTHIFFPDMEEQSHFITSIGAELEFFPTNTDNRRNIAFLMALERGADLLVAFDGDNHIENVSEYFHQHSIVSSPETTHNVLSSSTGWFNLGDLLNYESSSTLYPRGFPYSQRGSQTEYAYTLKYDRVVVNIGLWTQEPDVDSVARLMGSFKIKSVQAPQSFLDYNTWTPINTQNTAFNADILPAFHYVRMKHAIGGYEIDRFGDIFGGYLLQACMQNLKQGCISVGYPIVRHERESRNHLSELKKEFGAILLLEECIEFFKSSQLTSGNYSDCYLELADNLMTFSHKARGDIWELGGREFILRTSERMQKWVGFCRTIQGTS
jgi:hypothetical protein